MKTKYTTVFAIAMLFVLVGAIQAQYNYYPTSRWSWDPRSSAIYPSGSYEQLPAAPNILPITETRVYQTPIGVLAVNPSIRILPSTTMTQTELPIVCCRTNQLLMFGSSNAVTTTGSTINSSSFITTNGGASWFGQDYINNGNSANQRGDPGPTYDKNQRVIFTHLNSPSLWANPNGIAAEYSTNYGQNFSASVTIHLGTYDDKNLAGTDDNPGSPYYGYSYCGWCDYNVGTGFFARTTNGGVTWETPVSWNPPSGLYTQGMDVDACPNGTIIECFALHGGSSPWTETGCGIARSTNGGVSFVTQQPAYATLGTRSTSYNGWGIRTNGFPRMSIDKSGGPRNGWIYVVMPEAGLAPAGSDGDVIMHRSTDNGLTWSAGIRVNQDPLNNGKVQFFPCINVDGSGGINVLYYDNRNFPSVGDSATLFLSRSVDGGATWTDVELADHHFKPKNCPPLSSGYMGDYIGVTSGNNKVWGIWMDDKAQLNVFNAWVASVDLGPSINHTPLPNTENLAGPYVVNCVITPAGSAIDPTKTRLLWSRNNPLITDSLLLTNTSGNNWTGNIPGNGLAATYRYYLKTADMLGRVATAPPGAPGVLYSFVASVDTIKPVIVHTPITTWPKINWPATINANITDNVGVDSGWVEWYKNTPSTIKEFRLIPTGGGNYSAVFNSVNSDVNVGDSIFYVIKARDISSNHNLAQLPVSGYFKILIVQSFPLPPFCRCDDITYTPVTGSPGPSGDDVTITVNIGFTFYFMGHAVTQASICTNGFVILGASTYNGFSNALCTTSGNANPMLAPFWDDLNTLNGGNIQYTTLGTAPNRIFVVQFTNVAYFSGSGNVTFQVRLYEDPGALTGNIEFIYGPAVNNPASAGSVGETDTLGGPNHIYSITPGATCANTTFSTTSCNDAVAYNFPSGRRYTFNCLVGIPPIGTNGIPREFKLTQNYPNPFNPSTTIKFSIPKTSLVRLVVYDVIGRQVKTLVSEQKLPGEYDVSFDGSALASGVYFYKLEAGTFTDVKKMVLIK